jgi:hypothetical protein
VSIASPKVSADAPGSGVTDSRLTDGARAAPGGSDRRLPRLLAGYTIGLAGLAAAGLYAPLLAAAAPLAGLAAGRPILALALAAAAAAAADGSAARARRPGVTEGSGSRGRRP